MSAHLVKAGVYSLNLTRLHVKNYRILEDCCIDFTDNLTVIVGKNNTGKTAIAGVMSKFFGSGGTFVLDDLSLCAKARIHSVVARRAQPDQNSGIEATVVIEYSESDSLRNIKPLLMDLDPENTTVAIKFAYSLAEAKISQCCTDYSDYLLKLNQDDSEEAFSRFMSPRLSKYFTLSARPVMCNNGILEETKLGAKLKSADISHIIRIECIAASRDVSNKEANSSLSARAAKYYQSFRDSSLEETSNKLLSLLASFDCQLDDIYEKLFKDLSQTISTFGGSQPGEIDARIVSQMSEIELLNESTAIKYRSAEGAMLPESHNGLGYMNLMSMLMDINQKTAELRHDDDGDSADVNLLFIEEPEAHTHPQLQTIFAKNLKSLLERCRNPKKGSCVSLQCVLTTHSAHIVASVDFEDMRYMLRSSSKSATARNLNELEAEYKKEDDSNRARYKFIKQYITTDRADIFFADKLLLIEGDAERIMLPAMLRKLDKENRDEDAIPILSQSISMVTIGAYAKVFLPLVNFLGLKTLIITDADYGKGTHGTACPFSECDKTKNCTIRELLCDETASAENVRKLFSEAKLHTFKFTDKGWMQDRNGNLALAFQATEMVNDREYTARSFEDSFIHSNMVFLANHIDNFTSLASNNAIEDFKNTDSDPFILASKIDKKTSFAMDVLLNSQDEEDASWTVPPYIKRGLAWLANA